MSIRIVLGLSVCLALGASAAQDPVRIGAVLPLTGPDAAAGAMIREGYELAIAAKMRDGGVRVGGRRVPVELVVRDDHGAPAAAAEETRALVAQKIDLLLGGFGGAQIAPQFAIADEEHLPYVVVEGSPSAAMRASPYFFSVLAPLELLAGTTMRWIDDERRAGALPAEVRVALLWEESDHGRDYRHAVLAATGTGKDPKQGYRLVLDHSFAPGAREHGKLLDAVRAAQADVLLVDAHYADFVTLHREYAASGLCHKVLSYGVRGAEPQAAKDLPPRSLDYLVSTGWWNKDMHGASQEFVREFEARFQRVPGWQDALGYEAARALLAAVERAGSKDRESVRKALAELKMESILPGGFLSFPKEYGHQARYLHVVQQNQPDGTSPVISPLIASQARAVVPNPRCAESARR